ncbi:gram-negative bacteria-binding protein 3-like [Scaptodrosophila lebanonensis]|uniref:Gram-negative bacteria-binding protein 3-like n=1 Tax=Drosophila lebanonensis TaxID=7225 RepID=A0A6J2UL92_DROLE|nr:gram-negative bacteria-binding protein 3-like [Scaptodrosophila lebanonensis]
MASLSFALFCGYFLAIILISHAFEAPKAQIKVLKPKGFEVSIPDQNGISLFAFHGKLNKGFNGLEAGQFSRDITKAEGGRWTYRDTETELKSGDTLYFWTYVLYNGQGYREDNGKFVV